MPGLALFRSNMGSISSLVESTSSKSRCSSVGKVQRSPSVNSHVTKTGATSPLPSLAEHDDNTSQEGFTDLDVTMDITKIGDAEDNVDNVVERVAEEDPVVTVVKEGPCSSDSPQSTTSTT